ncbi:MAG: hypothetical protein JOZ40_07575, partial [Methylobacteriaceae bacterium]|nr:hypothetical protein [Methylobacteriaceae bacterium]
RVELVEHRHELAIADATPRPRRLAIRLPRPHEAWADRVVPFTSQVRDLGDVPSASLPDVLRPQLRRLAVRADLADDPLAALADPAYAALEELAVDGRVHPKGFAPLVRTDHLALRVLRFDMALDRALIAEILASPLARTLEVLAVAGSEPVILSA